MTEELAQQVYTSPSTVIMLSIFSIILLVVFIAVLILCLISLWKLFKKADEKGWKAFIPIYDIYILFKICDRKVLFWVALACYVVSLLISNFSNFLDNFVLFILFNIVGVACLIAFIVVFVVINIRLSKSFGHGVGFAIGLILLNFVFIPILAFGPSSYKKLED